MACTNKACPKGGQKQEVAISCFLSFRKHRSKYTSPRCWSQKKTPKHNLHHCWFQNWGIKKEQTNCMKKPYYMMHQVLWPASNTQLTHRLNTERVVWPAINWVAGDSFAALRRGLRESLFSLLRQILFLTWLLLGNEQCQGDAAVVSQGPLA